MIKIQKEYVSGSGSKYIRTLDASLKQGSVGDNEKVTWKCEGRKIRHARYLSMEQWDDIERQVREAYAQEYDVDFTSVFEIYRKDYSGTDGILFYETYFKGDEQFGHSSNIQHIGPVGSYVPPPQVNHPSQNYTTTKTTSFSFYAKEARAQAAASANEAPAESPRNRNPEPQRVIQIDYAALGIKC